MNTESHISQRERRLMVITVSIVSLAAIYFFVIDPIYKQYQELNQQIYTKQVRLVKHLKLMREKDVVTQEFKKYGAKLKTKNSNEEEMASVLSELERIGKTAGIYFSSVKPHKIRDMDFYKVLLVEIKFQANTQTLAKFIYDIQSSDSLLKVKRLMINIKGGNSALLEGVLQISKVSLS